MFTSCIVLGRKFDLGNSRPLWAANQVRWIIDATIQHGLLKMLVPRIFVCEISPVATLLARDDCTLENLLDEDELLQELNHNNEELAELYVLAPIVDVTSCLTVVLGFMYVHTTARWYDARFSFIINCTYLYFILCRRCNLRTSFQRGKFTKFLRLSHAIALCCGAAFPTPMLYAR